MKTRLFAVWVLTAVMAGCGAPSVGVGSTPEADQTEVSGTLTASVPSAVPTEPSLPSSPTATPGPPQLWTCYSCSGDTLWQLDSEGFRQVHLPVSIGSYYGYNSLTDQVLGAAKFADHGAGPGNVSVSDLSVFDLASGAVTQILPDNVVEAAWIPGGASLAYVLATPSTYELRWRTASGDDHLLASDVSFTWSVAPSGEAIAFTRESGYELQVPPGLFVVSLADRKEVALSDADKGGTGSIADRPVWSPDSREVIFSLWGGPDTRLIMARADGSEVFDLKPSPQLADAWWSDLQVTSLLWFPDGDHVLVNTNAINPDSGTEGMGGPTALVAYRIDRTQQHLTDGRLLGMVMGLIDWKVPGESAWTIGSGGQPEPVSVSGGG